MSVAIAPGRIPLQKMKLFASIDAIPTLKGAGVAYIGAGGSYLLRRSAHVSGLETYVVLREEPGPAMSLAGMTTGTKPTPTTAMAAQQKERSIWIELRDLGISCGSAVAAGVAAGAGALATPVTGGTSAIVTYVSGAAAVASAATCGISIGRVINEVVDPRTNETYLDNYEWYQRTSNVLDGIQLLGVATSLPSTYKGLRQLLIMQNTTKKPFLELLKGFSRPQRKALAEELGKYASDVASKKQWKALVKAGKLPKIFDSNALTAAVKVNLSQAVGNSLDMTGSSLSGNLNNFYIYVTQE